MGKVSSNMPVMTSTDTLVAGVDFHVPANIQGGLVIPGVGAFTITPGNALVKNTRAVYVGGAGNMAVTMSDGTSVTFVGLLAGLMYPLQLSAVAAGGTTAFNLIGVY